MSIRRSIGKGKLNKQFNSPVIRSNSSIKYSVPSISDIEYQMIKQIDIENNKNVKGRDPIQYILQDEIMQGVRLYGGGWIPPSITETVFFDNVKRMGLTQKKKYSEYYVTKDGKEVIITRIEFSNGNHLAVKYNNRYYQVSNQRGIHNGLTKLQQMIN